MDFRAPLNFDLLTVDDVAALLRCARDTVYRVPRDRLPVYRPGKCNLYLRDDVIRYVRSCRVEPAALGRTNADVERIVAEIAARGTDHADVVPSPADGVRGRSPRRTS